jgi:serine/threonine protein kinase
MSTGTAENSLSHDPLVGETLGGRYKIDRLIGRGGIGLVYLALDEVEGRKVVVKVLAPHWTDDDDAVARFDREALRMAKLDHPNVVRMYDHGHHGEQAYIVMEFLDGEPLRNYLNRKKTLGFEEFIPIASQVLAGAGYVHARNIMLRDIKPPNIMLCERDGKANHVKMLDFGLAKLMGEDDELTKAHVIGTAGYLSPEQIRGEKIDVRVDVYALGIMFFLMLTGESPIEGDNDAAVLFNHVHGDRRRLEELLPAGHRVPKELCALIHQCLSKNPDERPADANEMAEVLFESVHPSMFLLPAASDVTRRPAQEYWAKRLKKGAAALAEDLEASSGEHTRPVIKRTLEEVRDATALESSPRPPPSRKPAAVPSGPRKLPPAKPPLRTPTAATPTAGKRSPTQFGMPKAAERLKPPPPPKPSSTTLGLPVPKRLRASTPAPGRSNSGPMPRPKLLPADESSSRLPKPKPASAAAVPPRRVGTEAPAANVAAPVDSGLTVQFDADDARAAALKEHAPTSAVPGGFAAAAGLGIPALVEGADNDSLPIAIEEEPGLLGTPADITAVGTGPITSVGSSVDGGGGSSRLPLVLVVAGLAALALGGTTAYFALSGPSDPVADAGTTPAKRADDGAEAPKEAPVPAVLDDGGADDQPEPVIAVDDDEPALGRLKVAGPAGAVLYIDDAKAGVLPYDEPLALGEHALRVELAGHETWESTVDVDADGPTSLDAQPTKLAPGAKPRPASKRPKPTPSKPTPPATTDPGPTKPPPPSSTDAPPDKPKPKPKEDVFMNTSKGNDDGGIFLPVGK